MSSDCWPKQNVDIWYTYLSLEEDRIMTSPSDHSRKRKEYFSPQDCSWEAALTCLHFRMTRAGDFCVQLCERTRGLPKLILCLCLVILQGAMFNVFMYLQLGPLWLCWFLYDALNLAMCIAAFVVSSRFKEEQRKGKSSRRTIGWLAWLILEVSLNKWLQPRWTNK